MEERRARYGTASAEVLRRLTPEQVALIDAVRNGSKGGDIVSFAAYPYPREILRLVRQVLREHGIDGESIVVARIRASSGFVGVVGGELTSPHELTEIERAVLSAVADLASQALR